MQKDLFFFVFLLHWLWQDELQLQLHTEFRLLLMLCYYGFCIAQIFSKHWKIKFGIELLKVSGVEWNKVWTGALISDWKKINGPYQPTTQHIRISHTQFQWSAKNSHCIHAIGPNQWCVGCTAVQRVRWTKKMKKILQTDV